MTTDWMREFDERVAALDARELKLMEQQPSSRLRDTAALCREWVVLYQEARSVAIAAGPVPPLLGNLLAVSVSLKEQRAERYEEWAASAEARAARREATS